MTKAKEKIYSLRRETIEDMFVGVPLKKLPYVFTGTALELEAYVIEQGLILKTSEYGKQFYQDPNPNITYDLVKRRSYKGV